MDRDIGAGSEGRNNNVRARDHLGAWAVLWQGGVRVQQ